MADASWNQTWRYVAGFAVCAVFGYYAFVRSTGVPLMGGINLGFHELGHFLTFWLPTVAMTMMGSIAQVLAPLAFGVYFFVYRKDHFAAVFCLAWMAASMQDASVYIADAPYEQLPLIGGHHDWAYVLGHFGKLHLAESIAGTVKLGGLVVLVCGAALCVLGLCLPQADEVSDVSLDQPPWRAARKPSPQG